MPDLRVESFEFVKPFGLFAIAPFPLIFLVYLVCMGIMAGDQSVGFIFTVACTCVYPFLTVNAWLATSDLVIDENGVSRTLFGKVWRRILWSNVSVVKVNEFLSLKTSKVAKSITIYPKVKPRIRFWPSGKMMLPAKVERPERLIEVMNAYVSANRIAVEKVSDGYKTDASTL